MADGTSPVPTAPAEAMTPSGINHLVINVRDIEESHRFWTEILGFKQVGVSLRGGKPSRFVWRDQLYTVLAVRDRWMSSPEGLPAPGGDPVGRRQGVGAPEALVPVAEGQLRHLNGARHRN